MSSHEPRTAFKDRGRIVIVGASLAGLSAAETLRAEGFRGPLTVIGDEPYLPYDRPPLSKAVLTGWIAAEQTQLPRRERNSCAMSRRSSSYRLGPPWTRFPLLGRRFPRACSSRWPWPQATVTRRGSQTRIALIRSGVIMSTWGSAAASTSALAPRWHA
jgi:hypothetical protein